VYQTAKREIALLTWQKPAGEGGPHSQGQTDEEIGEEPLVECLQPTDTSMPLLTRGLLTQTLKCGVISKRPPGGLY